MKLYHGSYCKVEYPDIEYSRDLLDFGKGFYVTTIPEQANSWAKTASVLKNKQYGIVTVYKSFAEKLLYSYNYLDFNKCDEDWLDFIISCRNGSNIIHFNYDIISGPVADGNIAKYIRSYEKGFISKEELLDNLRFNKPTN